MIDAITLALLIQFSNLTYNQDVQPIFNKNCYTCHVPGNGMADFSTYEKAYDMRFKIRDRINSREMPYYGDFLSFENDRKVINIWIQQGANR